MKNKCPYCNKNDCVDYRVISNAENYGGGLFDVPCIHCNKMICISLRRTVTILDIYKSKKKPSESDFPTR